jgi:hypothetical protein
MGGAAHPHAKDYWSTHTSSGSGSGIGPLLRELHIPWPEANENTLNSAASDWHSLAEAIREANGLANSNAQSVTSNNQGSAIDAFEKYWSQFGGPKGALPAAASACDAMSTACSKYASAVSSTKHKIEEAGAEVAATLILGTIGAFFTFGATEGVADSVAAGLMATVTGFMDDLAGAAGDAVWGISQTAAAGIWGGGNILVDALGSEAATTLTSGVISGSLTGMGGSMTSSIATDSINALYGEEPLSPSDLLKDLLIGGLAGGATGGLLGAAGEMTTEQLAQVLRNAADTVQDTNPQQYVDMVTLANRLQGMTGKITTGVFASVASQLLTTQQLDAEGVTSDQLEELLEKAADK